MATATLRVMPKEAHRSKQPQAACAAAKATSELLIYPPVPSTTAPLIDVRGALNGLAADHPAASVLDLASARPWRPVDRRWQLAVRIAQKLKVPRAWRDPQILAAAKLLTRLASGTPMDHRYIERTMPELAEAHQLRFVTTTAFRLEIEARLLADESLESIAKKTCVMPAVLDVYQKLFFDVTDRLSRPSYILHVVIGPRVYATWTDEDIPTVGWKLFGFVGGPHVLDALIHGFHQQNRPSSPQSVGDFLSGAFAALLNSKAPMGVHTIDFRNPRNFKRLLRWVMHSQVVQRQKTKLDKVDCEPNLRAFNEQIGVMFKPSCAQPQPVG